MNKAVYLILLAYVASAIEYPSVYDQLYVNVGDTFRKPLTEFFSTNDKWYFRMTGQYPKEISIVNDDFEQTQLVSQYSQELKQIISAKPYVIDEYYHLGNLFGFLSKDENEKYVFLFNSEASAEPKFDKSIDLSIASEGLTCLDFDFYNKDEVVIVCTQEEAGVITNYHFLRVNLQTSVIQVSQFAPKQIYNEIPKLRLVIQQMKSQQNTKSLYIGVSSFKEQTKSYQSPSIIEQYKISDNQLNFDKVIDDVFVSRNYKRKAGLYLVDFTVIGNDLLIVDKEPDDEELSNDDAYIYIVRTELLTDKVDPQKIQVKRSTRAYLDSSYVYLHKQEQYTLSKQYYLSIIFQGDYQTLTDSQNVLTSYSQLKYQDKGNNIIQKITQNYKIILNTETKKISVQHLYRKTYEKILQLEGQPLGLIANQQTDSIIILFNSYSTQYTIQEPYILVKPQKVKEIKTYYVVANTKQSQNYEVDVPFVYQALQNMDQSIYIKNPQTISRIDAKQINGKVSTITPIVAFGPFVELDYEQNSDMKLKVLKSKTVFVTVNNLLMNGINYHIAKRFTSGVAIIRKMDEDNQQGLSCKMDIDLAECIQIQLDSKDTIAQVYSFSQSSDRYDFGIQSQYQVDVYLDKQFSFSLKRISTIKSFIMTGELLIIQDNQSIVFYHYQESDHSTPIYTIDSQLLQPLGYIKNKEFTPQKFFMNYDLSNLLIIQNNKDLIIGRYDSRFQIIDTLEINSDNNIFASINENGFYVLEQKATYQSLKAYSLIKNKIELLSDNPLKDFILLNDQAFDPITSVFVISAQQDEKYYILVVDPKLQPRDAIYRVIYLEDNIPIQNLQITSQGDILSITGFVDNKLKQYSTVRSAFFVEGQLAQASGFSTYKYLDMEYSNSESNVVTQQFVNIINDFNLIQVKSITQMPEQVNQKGYQILKLPKDILTGNIANYELNCEQCSSHNIILQPPMFKTYEEYNIGNQKECRRLNGQGLLLCINANNIKLFQYQKVLDKYELNGKGVYLYAWKSNFIATLTDSSLVFLIQDEKIIIQSTNQYLAGYDQQLINLEDQFILTLHYGHYDKYDGYEIFEFIIVKGLVVLKSTQVKYVENIRSCSYDAYFQAIQYVCGDKYLYYQIVRIKDQYIYFYDQFSIDVKMEMEEGDKVYLADPKFIWIADIHQSYKFFLYDSDGNGYKVSIQHKIYYTMYFHVLQILPTGRYEGMRVNSSKINNQFIVINRQFSDGDYVMVYKYNQLPDNILIQYMIGAQKVLSHVNILIQQSDHSTLGIQVEEGIFCYYKLQDSTSVVIQDGSAYNSQTLSIKASNFYQSQVTSIYLEKAINETNSSGLLWLYITLPVLIISGIIILVVYQRFKQKQQVGQLQQSLQQFQE